MRVVHALGWYFPESIGGTEVYVDGLCRRLSARGHEVFVAAPDATANDVRTYVANGTPVFRYPIPAAPSRDEAQGLLPTRGSEELARFVDATRPDIFHLHSIVTGLGRFEVERAKRAGARTVLTHHLPSFGYVCRRGTLMENGVAPCDGAPAVRRCAACVLRDRGVAEPVARALASIPVPLSAVIGRLAGKAGTAAGLAASIARDRMSQHDLDEACDAHVVLNETARRILLTNGTPPRKIILNRLGHSHRTLPPRTRAEAVAPVRFGFVGRLHPTKGVVELARAAASVPRDVQFSVEICGPAAGAAEQAVRDTIAGIVARDSRITIRGPIAPSDILNVLGTYDVLCCPSTWFENGPTVAIEALAVGTPVIGARIGNLAELVEDGVTGRLVPAGDERALAHALAEVARTPAVANAWRSRLGAARTMDAIADDYAALYEALVADAGGGAAVSGAA